ncbi:uncharacterized protein CCOS01_14079 [Colletotrichum costaricense]|uniref:Uncharacterized protein n=1 Tax=Colletotrichum costaricense TaxID=1209916 RepID=A0AAJ0DUM4_9PEZI|nr:uncharacterized protein CCOS01_14079 [Colletotrichum costaricense]KAK1514139.1 hypothetical protein CCOS01_14079 [Colletotrichum costaricense]
MDRRRGGEWHPQATHGSRSVSALSKSQRFGDSRQTPPMEDIRVGLIDALIGPRFALLRDPYCSVSAWFSKKRTCREQKKGHPDGMVWDGRERPTRPRGRQQQQQRTDTAAPSTEPLSPIRTPLLGSFLPFHLLPLLLPPFCMTSRLSFSVPRYEVVPFLPILIPSQYLLQQLAT